MNSTSVAGRLTRDVELAYTANKVAIANFSIADNQGKDRDGNKKVTFFDCKAFGKQAETINKYCKKGALLNVAGQLETEHWEKDGQPKKKIVLKVNQFGFLGDQKDTPEPQRDEATF